MTIYDYTLVGIDGTEISLAQYRGKKIMIVNVASECGYTLQYAQLQELYTTLEKDLVILGVPTNDFGGQEPGDNMQIQKFCSTRFSVTFPMAAKTTVVGHDKNPVYQWLTQKEHNGVRDSEVKWNFQKYLIDEQGQLTHIFASSVEPLSDEIFAALGLSL